MTPPVAIIGRVTNVEPHPHSDTLDVISIGGKTNVANREVADTPRYKIGDYAVMLVDDLILPDWLLHHLDLWNTEKAKGYLAGSKGNRTKARNIAGIVSDVAVCRVDWKSEARPLHNFDKYVVEHLTIWMAGLTFTMMFVKVSDSGTPSITPEGIDVSAMFGIQPYERP